MLIGNVKKLLSLKATAFMTLVEIWLKLLLAWLSFACLPQSTASRIWFKEERQLNEKPNGPSNLGKKAATSSLVKLLQIAVSHHIVKLTCLHRVLILNNMLSKKDIASSIVIGVRKDKDSLAAHAWLQIGDEIIADKKSYTDQFKPLSNPGSASLMLLNRPT